MLRRGPSAIGSTPANSCGNGSTPAARERVELAPARGEDVRGLTPLRGSLDDVDLGDLQLALAPRA